MESLYVRIPAKAGEEVRRKLLELGTINRDLKIKPGDGFLLIPVIEHVEGYDMGKGDFEVLEKQRSPAEILGFAPAYEQIGDIAIIDRYEPGAKSIADILLRQNRIRTVFQAETPISGEYRTRGLTLLAGEGRTETLYRENGCRFLLDVSRVYFTPRLATERLRVANQVHNGDTVVDMFAGVGPFCILIAKKFPSARVVAIDKNPDAIHYLRENVKLNKVRNVEIREGDAREEIRGLSDADQVIMNLPHSGLEFIGDALRIVKKGGMIHFYAIAHEDDLFEGVLKKIEETAGRLDLRIIPLDRRVVRPYAPYQYNICIDFQVT